MGTKWNVEQTGNGFRLRVQCGPVGETGREEEWTGAITVGADGRAGVDGMIGGSIPRTGGQHYLKNSLEPEEAEALPRMLEEIAARCAWATREVELWERSRPQREAEASKNIGMSREALASLAAAGQQEI